MKHIRNNGILAARTPSVPQLAVIAVLALSVTNGAFAGSATWNTSAGSTDWNTATNWTPQTVPNGLSDTARFDVSNTTGISVSANTEVNGIVFNAGASAFTIAAGPTLTLTISGAGITNNSGITQSFLTTTASASFTRGTIAFTNSATAGSGTVFTNSAGSSPGTTEFLDASSAGSSTVIANGGGVTSTGGAFVLFGSNSSAGDATIIANGAVATGAIGGDVQFQQTSTAGNATLIANDQAGSGSGGMIEFFDDSRGGTARVEMFGGGSLHIEFHNKTFDVSVGSIEGDGIIVLAGGAGTRNLVVGSNNLNTTFSGDIVGGGGSLTKVGTGTLTLTNGIRDYTATIIKRGTLLVNNTTGSGTGGGGVFVDGGTLGGNGRIATGVSIGDGSGRGAFLAPGFRRSSTSTFRLGNLVFNSDATYKLQLNSTRAKADKVITTDVTISSGAQFSFTDIGNGTLAPGTIFKIINNRSASPIAGTFSNLPDGAAFITNGNTFKANYEGGDGNDLTLTVQ